MTSYSEEHPLLRIRLRMITQVVWLILASFLLIVFLVGIPNRFNHLMSIVKPDEMSLFPGMSPDLEAIATMRLGPDEVNALKSLGLSQSFYSGYILFFEIVLLVSGTAIGVFIFWRRSNDWMALWVSILTVLLGTNSVSLVVPSLVLVWPGWILVTTLIGFIGMVSNVHILFLSPDGRFVPRWTQIITAVFTGWMLGVGIYSTIIFLYSGLIDILPLLFLVFPIWLGLLGMGIVSQIHRYRRVSDIVQRQQTKWVALGLAAVTLGFLINASNLFITSLYSGLSRVLLNLVRAPLVNLCMVLLPVCLAFSIFRYRLWDIDIIIRRTLQYGLLTGLLALIYFGGVVLTQSAFSALIGNADSPLITVISTLAIVVLFTPLRTRVQDFIDRRFYRAKYDAERTLAQFAATVRDEVDVERLTSALLGVVEETMQPERISLWLIKHKLKGTE